MDVNQVGGVIKPPEAWKQRPGNSREVRQTGPDGTPFNAANSGFRPTPFAIKGDTGSSPAPLSMDIAGSKAQIASRPPPPEKRAVSAPSSNELINANNRAAECSDQLKKLRVDCEERVSSKALEFQKAVADRDARIKVLEATALKNASASKAAEETRKCLADLKDLQALLEKAKADKKAADSRAAAAEDDARSKARDAERLARDLKRETSEHDVTKKSFAASQKTVESAGDRVFALARENDALKEQVESLKRDSVDDCKLKLEAAQDRLYREKNARASDADRAAESLKVALDTIASLNAAVSDLGGKNVDCEKLVAKLRGLLDDAEDKLAESEKKAAQEAAALRAAQGSQIQLNKTAVDQMNARLDAERERAAAEKARMEDKVRKADDEIADLRKKAAEADAKVAAIQARLADCEAGRGDADADLVTARKDCAATIAKLETSHAEYVTAFESKIEVLDKALADCDRDKSGASESIEKLRQSMAAFESRIASLTAELAVCGSDKGALSETIESLRVTINEFEVRVSTLTTKLGECERHKDGTASLRESMLVLESRVSALDKELVDCGGEKGRMSELIASLRESVSDLESRIVTAGGVSERTIAELRASNSVYERTIAELRSSMSTYENSGLDCGVIVGACTNFVKACYDAFNAILAVYDARTTVTVAVMSLSWENFQSAKAVYNRALDASDAATTASFVALKDLGRALGSQGCRPPTWDWVGPAPRTKDVALSNMFQSVFNQPVKVTKPGPRWSGGGSGSNATVLGAWALGAVTVAMSLVPR
jgi:chromosome segregation ATPase